MPGQTAPRVAPTPLAMARPHQTSAHGFLCVQDQGGWDDCTWAGYERIAFVFVDSLEVGGYLYAGATLTACTFPASFDDFSRDRAAGSVRRRLRRSRRRGASREPAARPLRERVGRKPRSRFNLTSHVRASKTMALSHVLYRASLRADSRASFASWMASHEPRTPVCVIYRGGCPTH
eukprot:SAG11_NODE_3_length_39220_cov_67.005828_25_plen_177_part_00